MMCKLAEGHEESAQDWAHRDKQLGTGEVADATAGSTFSAPEAIEGKFLTESKFAFFGGSCYVQFWVFLSHINRK